MTEIKKLFREANQMILGERLYYLVHLRDIEALESYAPKSAALRQALKETSPLEGHPAALFLVPVDLIKGAEGDVIS